MKITKKNSIFSLITLVLFYIFFIAGIIFINGSKKNSFEDPFRLLFHIFILLSIIIYIINVILDNGIYRIIALILSILMLGCEAYLIWFDCGLYNSDLTDYYVSICVFCLFAILVLGSTILGRFIYKKILIFKQKNNQKLCFFSRNFSPIFSVPHAL